jgi:hypothetical protein
MEERMLTTNRTLTAKTQVNGEQTVEGKLRKLKEWYR